MTGTLTPPPPVAPAPAPWHPELESRPPWWRRRWVLVVATLVVVFAGFAIYGATRPSEREQFVEDMQEQGLSESDAAQLADDVEQLEDEFGWRLQGSDPNDGYLSHAEVDMVRAVYTAYRETELGQLMELPDESVFTDEQIRGYTAEACEFARDSDALQEWQVRLGRAFADEPSPEAAGFLGGAGTTSACMDVAATIGASG